MAIDDEDKGEQHIAQVAFVAIFLRLNRSDEVRAARRAR
jgi:hypothetical protein